MFDPLECFRSVGDVWVLWVASAAALVVTTRSAVLRVRRLRPARLLADERGASYAISLAMVIPFHFLLVATIIECTLILVVKMGTVYAAYAAARAAIVWVPGNPAMAREKIELAAIQAMAPFAASNPKYSNSPASGVTADAAGNAAYYAAYQRYCGGALPLDYFAGKRHYAAQAVTVMLSPEYIAGDASPDADITVTLSYEMPFDIPGVGRFLGHAAPWPGAAFFTRTVTSTVTLQKEGIRSANPKHRKLGIHYDSTN